jgi:hypothetical protein
VVCLQPLASCVQDRVAPLPRCLGLTTGLCSAQALLLLLLLLLQQYATGVLLKRSYLMTACQTLCQVAATSYLS